MNNNQLVMREYLKTKYLHDSDNGNEYNTFITFNPNKSGMKIDVLKKSINHFYNNMCCRIYRGKQFYTEDLQFVKYSDYFNYIGFLEHTISGSPHYHLLAYIDPIRYEYFCKLSSKFWKKQVKSGTIDVQPINPKTYSNLIDYCTKKLDYKLYQDNMIFL